MAIFEQIGLPKWSLIMTLVLNIPEQTLQQAEATARANGKTLQQILEEYVDVLSQQKTPTDWQQLAERLPDVPELTEEDIAAEIKLVRIERRGRTKA